MTWCAKLGTPLLATVLLLGCADTQPTRFYSLVPIIDAVQPPERPWPKAVSVVVGPVTLPRYLERPQVVTRPGTYAVDVNEFHRWAEPLETMVPRVLVQDLAARLGTDQVFLRPRRRGPDVSHQVEVTFYRFDLDEENRVVLIAAWDVVHGADEVVVASRKSTVTAAATTPDFEAMADAMSRALAVLSQEIAVFLSQLPRSPDRTEGRPQAGRSARSF